jgi:hypothetical protein
MEAAVAEYERLAPSVIGAFSIDAAVILSVVILFGWIALHYGKSRSIAVILALYIALLGYLNFPYSEQFFAFGETALHTLAIQAGLFIGMAIIAFVSIINVVVSESASGVVGKWIETLLLSLSTAALLIAFSYHVLPISEIYDFGSPIDQLFEVSSLFFWWLVGPLVILFFLTRRG